jgi:signal peptidase complex subunit 3
MHNLWVRLNAVVFFALTVLLALATLAAFSTYLHAGEPKVKVLRFDKLTQLMHYNGNDRAKLNFHLNADLTPAFHWNVKQLFVFMVAEYETEKARLNQVIIWDKIIESKEDAIIKVKKQDLKYALMSQGADLRGRDVTLKLMWDHMPITGRLYMGSNTKNDTFTTPKELTTKSSSKSGFKPRR